MNVSAAYYTSIGKRSRNEDNISLQQNDSNTIAIIADGLGGEKNGELASQTTIKAVNGQLSCDNAEKEQISDAILHANDEILKLQGNGNKMKSTIAVLCINNGNAIVANVGDTRIYQFRKNKIIFQSTDHSVSQMCVSAGTISVDEIRGHIDRNRLTNALGSRGEVDVDITECSCKNGDAFLLCSDGFWEYVLEDEMCNDLSETKDSNEWLTRMRSRVEERISSNGDNHSAITIIVNGWV